MGVDDLYIWDDRQNERWANRKNSIVTCVQSFCEIDVQATRLVAINRPPERINVPGFASSSPPYALSARATGALNHLPTGPSPFFQSACTNDLVYYSNASRKIPCRCIMAINVALASPN
jgi:hypothetical protein